MCEGSAAVTWWFCISCLHSLCESLGVCGFSKMLTCLLLFRLGWLGATQFCFSFSYFWSLIWGCLWQRSKREMPQCAHDCHAPAHIVFANIPVAQACSMDESGLKGRGDLGPSVPSVRHIWLHLIPPYLLFIWTSPRNLERISVGVIFIQQLALGLRDLKRYTSYQFIEIYNSTWNQNLFVLESHWHKKEIEVRGWRKLV